MYRTVIIILTFIFACACLSSGPALADESESAKLEEIKALYGDGEFKKAYKAAKKFRKKHWRSDLVDEAGYYGGLALCGKGKTIDGLELICKVMKNHSRTSFGKKTAQDVVRLTNELCDRAIDKGDRGGFFGKSDLEYCVDFYEAARKAAPLSETGAEARAKLGRVYFALGRHEEAELEFEFFLKTYPHSVWTPEGLFGLAESRFFQSKRPAYDQTATTESLEQFESFVASYPNNARVPDAQKRIETLRERLAEYHYRIGTFYERKAKYEAASLAYLTSANDYAGTTWGEKSKERIEALQ